MQTFLPYPDFAESARVLDQKRLGKQITETYQIMQAILLNRGYIHHSAVDMWAGHEITLLRYQEAFYHEWHVMRGFNHVSMERTYDLFDTYSSMVGRWEYTPPWLGQEDLHYGMQSNLIRKDPEYYGPIFPGVPDDLPYVWYDSQGRRRNLDEGIEGPKPVRGEIRYI